MTAKERIDKRAKEMHKPILKEIRRLEGENSNLKAWIELARRYGILEADKQWRKHILIP